MASFAVAFMASTRAVEIAAPTGQSAGHVGAVRSTPSLRGKP